MQKSSLVILLSELITVYFEVKVETLSTPWRSTGKVNGDYVQLFVTAALDGGELSNSRYDRFVAGNEPALHDEHEAGWTPTRYGRLWKAKNSSTVPGIEPRIV
jgi:hypothetical protein